MRLIDANAAKRRIIAFATGCHSEVLSIDSVIMMLNQTPTVDAAEVVRCKDCEYCDPENRHCDHPQVTRVPIGRKPDDFCSYGERRNDEKRTD